MRINPYPFSVTCTHGHLWLVNWLECCCDWQETHRSPVHPSVWPSDHAGLCSCRTSTCPSQPSVQHDTHVCGLFLSKINFWCFFFYLTDYHRTANSSKDTSVMTFMTPHVTGRNACCDDVTWHVSKQAVILEKSQASRNILEFSRFFHFY